MPLSPFIFNKELQHNTKQSAPVDKIYWSKTLEMHLCKLYMQDDVINIFWGRPFTTKDLTWDVYVIMRGAYRPVLQKKLWMVK